MEFKLTEKTQNSKKCKDGKSRHLMTYYLNGVKLLTQKRPYDETMDEGFNGKWRFKDVYLLNGNLHQTRFRFTDVRNVQYPVSKKILNDLSVPNDLKIELCQK